MVIYNKYHHIHVQFSYYIHVYPVSYMFEDMCNIYHVIPYLDYLLAMSNNDNLLIYDFFYELIYYRIYYRAYKNIMSLFL